MRRLTLGLAALAGGAVLAGGASLLPTRGEDSGAVAPRLGAAAQADAPERLPGYAAERNAYFGDLHVHTKLSFDAYIFNVRASPDDAYRYARGEPLDHAGGYQVRLSGAPLDFVAVTDHSEYIGAIERANDPNDPLSREPVVQGLYSSEPAAITAAFNRIVAGYAANTLPASFTAPPVVAKAWGEVRDAAARNNDPGRFTTFVGYEFTSAPDGRNLHRNVIFKGARVPDAPYTAIGHNDPEGLWRVMDGWRGRGIEALAIPHNSNGSDGLMFEPTRRNGQPMDRAYAELRSRNEPWWR